MSMTQQERLKQLIESLEVTKDMAKEAAAVSDNPWEGRLLERLFRSIEFELSEAKAAKARLDTEIAQRSAEIRLRMRYEIPLPFNTSPPFVQHVRPFP